MGAVKVNVILDKRSQKSDGTYPVKVVVYHNQTNKRYSLKRKISLTEIDFDKINSPRLKQEEFVTIKNYLESEKARALKIIKELGGKFSYELFESLFFDIVPIEDKKAVDVYAMFDKHIKELFASKRIGTATSYQTAKRSLVKYYPKLTFSDITPAFLKKYELHMTEKGSSITTVAIYLRSLRTIINMAKEAELMTPEQYPFGQKTKKKYEIPIGRNIKKALSAVDIRKIKQVSDLSEEAEFARDIWLFSFYCSGMNMTDICHLKYENIQDGFIHYFRAKTIRTQREKTPVEVYLSEPAQKIIERWSKKSINPSDFVFNILNKEMSYEEQFWASKNFTRSVNHYMGILGKRLEINDHLTTYVARHSYATLLKFMGTSIEEISESLGHTNISTTKSYLDSFPKEHKKETSKKLSALIL